MPVVCIAPKDPWHEKMISQIQQAKARGGTVIAIATEGDELVQSMADHVLWVPETPWMLSPAITVIADAADIAGWIPHRRHPRLDVDQPR
jgi:glucosamine--fructose-6-phosphate aminotransferase (isomerizing)